MAAKAKSEPQRLPSELAKLGRRRKIKCDGNRPQCGSCISRGVSCSWPDSAAPGNYKVASQCSPSLPQERSSTDQERRRLKRVRTGFEKDGTRAPVHLSTALCSHALDIFLSRHHAIEFCSFFHTASLDANVMCIQHSFLAHAIVALASLYVTDEDAIKYGYKSKQELSEWHAGIARQASRQSVDDISIASIQANLILTLHELLSWKSLKAWVLAGIAIRHAQALRLGSEFNDRLSTRQKEIHRRTFWACFLMDRLLSYCCSRPQMIDLDTVRINLPCPESSFAFEEQYDGPSLKSFNPATSEVSRTGIAPFFIAFLSLWGKTGYFMVAHGRTATKEAPSDTHGTFWQLDQKLNDFYNALPPNIRWSNSNFKLYRSTGQAKLFVTFHLLLNHARVLLHQEYLPQLDSPGLEEAEATIHNSAERALDSNNRTISICVSSAEGIADIVSTLSSHGLSKPVELQSAFGANAMIAAAGVQMWIQHTEGSSEEMIDVAKYRIQQVSHEIRSWQSEWPVAVAWGDTLKSLGQLYDTFYTQSCNPASILTEIPDRETAEALSNCGEVSVQATERPSQGVSEGNGVPHPDSVCQRLFDKIRFVMLASLENPDVKKRMLKSYLRTLWQHMWLYEAVQGEYRATSLENLCWDDDWMNAIDMDGNL